jgi:hypothetical protein
VPPAELVPVTLTVGSGLPACRVQDVMLTAASVSVQDVKVREVSFPAIDVALVELLTSAETNVWLHVTTPRLVVRTAGLAVVPLIMGVPENTVLPGSRRSVVDAELGPALSASMLSVAIRAAADTLRIGIGYSLCIAVPLAQLCSNLIGITKTSTKHLKASIQHS